jgi:pimeloyl-ACP methyl ester carboxylesterase
MTKARDTGLTIGALRRGAVTFLLTGAAVGGLLAAPSTRAGASGSQSGAAATFKAALNVDTPAGVAPGDRSCATLTIPVALAPGMPTSQTIWAEYCTPRRPTTTVDVLVPGGTYDHLYWDWPIDPRRYNYIDKTLAAGRAVLTYDRLGTGASSRPASTTITADVSIYVLHQLVAWVRGRGYSQVDLVGHSLGSLLALQEAGTWPDDPSRLILTGLLHVTTKGQAISAGDQYPAYLDPKFAHDGYDPGYLTSKPGSRGPLYYYHGAPSVIAYDEASKTVVSGTEFSTALAAFYVAPPANISDSVTAPVLIIDGQEDFIFCFGGPVDCRNRAAIYRNEAPYFAYAASLTVESVPRTGHDLALNRSADRSFAMINDWIDHTPAATRRAFS